MARPLARARARFFEILRRHGNLTEAVRGSGLARAHALNLRETDADFAAAWEAAVAEAVDGLELAAWQRAVDGEACPVFYKGVEVGVRQRRSDRLLMFLLRGFRPGRYGGLRRPSPEEDSEEAGEPRLAVYELETPPGCDIMVAGPIHMFNGRAIEYEKIEAVEPKTGCLLPLGFAPDHPELQDLWEQQIRERMNSRQATREGRGEHFGSALSKSDAAKRACRPPPTRAPGLKPREDE